MTFSFHKQETTYTCGAASMQMALSLCGIKKSEKQVAKLLSTNKVRGTWHESFPIVAEKFKLNHVSLRNATITDLKLYQKKNFAVIVCYFYPTEKVDHYSVLKKLTQTTFISGIRFLEKNTNTLYHISRESGRATRNTTTRNDGSSQ